MKMLERVQSLVEETGHRKAQKLAWVFDSVDGLLWSREWPVHPLKIEVGRTLVDAGSKLSWVGCLSIR